MQNFFQLFSIDESFDIDLELLEEKYFTLQSKYHPDRARDEREKQDLITSSILINNAYTTLKDDAGRASHILLLHGIDITNDVSVPKLPIETLERILEMRETLEEMIFSKDADLTGFKAKISAQRDKLLNKLRLAFVAGDYPSAAEVAMEVRYLDRMLSA